MLIGELARCTGLTSDTIRFYEKQGLLDQTHFARAANGYRHYAASAVQRIALVRMGQAAGFTLAEMRLEIRAWESDERTPAEKEVQLCRKLDEIEAKIAALQRVQRYIAAKIEAMRPVQARPA